MKHLRKNFKEFSPSAIGIRLGYGEDVPSDSLSKEQKNELEGYINWKLNDEMNWWEELGVVGRVHVKVDTMIDDNDFYLAEHLKMVRNIMKFKVIMIDIGLLVSLYLMKTLRSLPIPICNERK